MHLQRQHVLAAVLLAGLCGVASLSYVLQRPSTAEAATSSHLDADRGSSSAVNEAGAPADEALPPLDELRMQAEALALTSRFFRERHQITDPDPESAEEKAAFDYSAPLPGVAEYRKVAHYHDSRDRPREKDVRSTNPALFDVNTTYQLTTPDGLAIADTPPLSRSPRLGLPAASADAALADEALYSVRRTGSVYDVRSMEPVTVIYGPTTARAEKLAVQAVKTKSELMDAMRSPGQTLAEYQRIKADYLAAKQKYQLARLLPLPPERRRDWHFHGPRVYR